MMSKRPTKEQIETAIAEQWPILEKLWPVGFEILSIEVVPSTHDIFETKEDGKDNPLISDIRWESRDGRIFVNLDHWIFEEREWKAELFGGLGHERGHFEEADIVNSVRCALPPRQRENLDRLEEMVGTRVWRILKWAWKEIFEKRKV